MADHPNDPMTPVRVLDTPPQRARSFEEPSLASSTLGLLVLGRFPLLVTIGTIAAGASLPLDLFLIALSLLPRILRLPLRPRNRSGAIEGAAFKLMHYPPAH